MGRCRHQWSPPGPPHPVWLSYRLTSEKLNVEQTLSVLPCSFQSLSSRTHVWERRCVCVCVTSILQQSVRLQGRVSPSNPSGGIWFVLLELFHSNTKWTLKECVSPLLSEALFCSLPPPQHLSQPPWYLADTPGGKRHNTNKNLLLNSPCVIPLWVPIFLCSSFVALPGQTFFCTSSFCPVYANTAWEKTELVENRKEHWLERLNWLRLGV